MDELSSEIVHIPPSSKSIKEFISKICDFINKDDDLFIHPIIKAIILHFLISFLHPFVDGNGRTARALFYWYMLKQGYSLIEYLAISKIIYEYKPLYEKAFLYTEIDDYDIGYFIEYNLDVLDKAYSKYQESLVKKDKENKALDSLKTSYSLSPRQLWIVRNGIENKSKVFTCELPPP
ncbi:MAG: Fic family protein [Spirochaetales bacterium]|nr:Fic family protein [Spirochaetales bacterium]